MLTDSMWNVYNFIDRHEVNIVNGIHPLGAMNAFTTSQCGPRVE